MKTRIFRPRLQISAETADKRVHTIESGLSGQIIKTQVMLVGQTSDYGSAKSTSEDHVHRGRRDKSRGTKSGGIGQRIFRTLLACREVKTCQRTETTDFGAQERDYRIGRPVRTRVD